MKYLGTNIRSPITKIFDVNGPRILRVIRDDVRTSPTFITDRQGKGDKEEQTILSYISLIVSPAIVKVKLPIILQFNMDNMKLDKKPSKTNVPSPRNQGGLGIPDVHGDYFA